MLVEQITENIYTSDTNGLTPDPVILTHDEMMSGHGVLRAKSGTPVHLSLEHGCHLHDGDILAKNETTVIYAEAADEDALVIYPKTSLEWGRVCYNIGNMHMKAFLNENSVTVPYDYVLESVIQKLGAQYERKTCKIKGIYANAGLSNHHHH